MSMFAMAGGMVLSLGNLSTQYAWAFVGLSVTEVVSAIGTTLNYYLDDKINRAEILFPGVGCFLIAVCLGSTVHASNNADNKTKLDNYSNESKDGVGSAIIVSPAGVLSSNGIIVESKAEASSSGIEPDASLMKGAIMVTRMAMKFQLALMFSYLYIICTDHHIFGTNRMNSNLKGS